jgi:hypothetical protein
MFSQFRVHYPKGSLLTELSAIDHGKYIVRCLVQVEGTTLVTALAAAQTVELAEDQARSRALAILGIDPTTASTGEEKTSVVDRVVLNPQTPTPIPSAALPSESLYQPPSNRFPEPSSVEETSSLSSLDLNREEVTERAGKAAWIADEMTVTDEPSTEVSTLQEVENPLWMTEKKSSQTQLEDTPVRSSTQSKRKLEEETSTTKAPETPIDFSDIIARTNVELKRLGWTTQKGKDYLLQTYGKRSRQLLSDAELLDFLHHLESEPTPED